MKVVIAGTYAHARRFVMEHGWTETIIFSTGETGAAEKLQGLHPDRVYWIGTFEEGRSFEHMREVVRRLEYMKHKPDDAICSYCKAVILQPLELVMHWSAELGRYSEFGTPNMHYVNGVRCGFLTSVPRLEESDYEAFCKVALDVLRE